MQKQLHRWYGARPYISCVYIKLCMGMVGFLVADAIAEMGALEIWAKYTTSSAGN